MTVEIPDLALRVHPGYGKALRVQRFVPSGSVVLSLEADVTRIPEPTATSIQVGIDEHIDGTPTLYLNHSCEPNVFVDATALTVIAIRDIQPGEDIQFFYPANEWHMSTPGPPHPALWSHWYRARPRRWHIDPHITVAMAH